MNRNSLNNVVILSGAFLAIIAYTEYYVSSPSHYEFLIVSVALAGAGTMAYGIMSKYKQRGDDEPE